MYFNARGVFTFTNKPYALCVARACGLSIPATLVSNEVGRISSWVGTHGGKDEGLAGGIVKPVCGGSFCSALDEVLPTVEAKNGALAAPAIVQSKLSSPELRIFGVAGHYLAFAVTSPSLDYRVHQDATLSFVECPRALAEGQHRLMEHMGLGYSACDYKTNDKTGQLEFLEVNNGAMFAAFDKASGGVLTRVMALLLAGEPVPPLSHVLVLSL